ncbi:MAG TPA: helix-turn-helix domain-containing protein [Thermodesulfobacteriota bacterium]|nr:helix-turn-helix domain-containing protein [Thermodesulfobacteriota bacterium]
MKTVFSTRNFKKTKRFAAWQDALCAHYLRVEASSQDHADYEGFLTKSTLGPTVLTEVFLSAQNIVRSREHIAHQSKDCYYIMFPSTGSLLIEQSGKQQVSTPGTAVLFDTTEPYRLRCRDQIRSIYVEIPRSMLIDRCPIDKLESVPALNFADGLGWAVTEFCKLLSLEADSLSEEVATKVANEMADLLAIYIDAEYNQSPNVESLSAKFRLKALKSYIESKLDDPNLAPGVIAKENRISVRYLHYLFKNSGTSVSEWIREERLKRCHQKLTSTKFEGESITDIAFSLGFNSSSHFTRLFKQKFGMPPRCARQKIK